LERAGNPGREIPAVVREQRNTAVRRMRESDCILRYRIRRTGGVARDRVPGAAALIQATRNVETQRLEHQSPERLVGGTTERERRGAVRSRVHRIGTIEALADRHPSRM